MKKQFLPVEFCLFEKPFKSNLLNMQYRNIKYTKLPRILRSCDRSSMSSSKELRVPLLDHRLVELSFSLTGEFKIKNGIQRFFMNDILKKIGNSRLIDQPKRVVVAP
jgi:asparagine synthase (glutamine-hydrolysing)